LANTPSGLLVGRNLCESAKSGEDYQSERIISL